MVTRTNSIPEIQQSVKGIRDNIDKIRANVRTQFASDMEHLKLYADEQGTTRLDMLGQIDKLCEMILLRTDRIDTCIEAVMTAAGKLEIKL